MEKLPPLLIALQGEENWFHNLEEVEKFLVDRSAILDIDLAEKESEEESALASTENSGEPSLDEPKADEPEQLVAHLTELHEVRTINGGLKDLQPLGFGLDDLLPADRTGSTTARFEIVRGEDVRRPLEDLRSLLPEIRGCRRKGPRCDSV